MHRSSVRVTAAALALAALVAAAGLGPWVLRGEELSMSNHRAALESAPDFDGISTWLNSSPLTIEALRGKVVLVQFWTLSCINWLRTLPYVADWHAKYKDKGLVVVGVHTPEFTFEHATSNVEAAIKRFGITYPVAQDNQYSTWKAYGNHYWPAEYLIDKSGKVVLAQFGEGRYRTIDGLIARLVGAELSAVKAGEPDQPDLSQIGSPEMYFGAARNDDALVRSQIMRAGQRPYTAPDDVPLNRFAFSGTWMLAGESATLAADGGEIIVRFRAPKVNLVAGSPTSQTLSITIDGQPLAPVAVQASQLYVLYEDAGGEHVLRITIPKAGLSAYTLTFG